MTILRTAIRLILGFGAVLALAASAEAQVAGLRFVASTGSDSNTCLTAATACRTLQHGVDLVTAGGEVRVVDSFNYGGVTITKSVTISADGATILGALTINNAGAVVTLRGLLLNGRGVVATGVNIVNAAVVHIADCEVERFTGNGIRLIAAGAELFIDGSVSRNNGIAGLFVNAAAKVTIEDSRFENNGDGMNVIGADLTVTRSVASGNSFVGIRLNSGTANIAWTTAANNGVDGYVVGPGSQMTLESSVARGNSAGIFVNGLARISNSVFTNNTTGIQNNSGTVLTRRNNTVSGNTTETSGTLTTLAGI
jgi:hypothetical protein